MPILTWDSLGSRIYETGLDRGVLYLSNGLGVPWNGLVSIQETNTTTVQEIYYDGIKNLDFPLINDYAGTINAITYPDEFLEYEGIVEAESGLFFTQQQLKTFGLSYRTLIGNDVEKENFGYKIHILYDLMAIPQNVTYKTLTESQDLIDFSWNVTSRPQLVTGYKPTAHVILDSTKVPSEVLYYIETILYGTTGSNARIPSITDLLDAYLLAGSIIITNNCDGTWTATGPDSLIRMLTGESFEISGVDAIYLDTETYQLTTVNSCTESTLVIVNNGDGTWTATGPDTIVSMLNPTTFQIITQNATYLTDTLYRIGPSQFVLVQNQNNTWSLTGPSEQISMLNSTTFQVENITGTYIDNTTYQISTS